MKSRFYQSQWAEFAGFAHDASTQDTNPLAKAANEAALAAYVATDDVYMFANSAKVLADKSSVGASVTLQMGLTCSRLSLKKAVGTVRDSAQAANEAAALAEQHSSESCKAAASRAREAALRAIEAAVFAAKIIQQIKDAEALSAKKHTEARDDIENAPLPSYLKPKLKTEEPKPTTGIRVQFSLSAPAPEELNSSFKFVKTTLIVLKPPLINHISPLSDKAHDGSTPLKLVDARPSYRTDPAEVLVLTKQDLKEIIIKFGAGWDKPNAFFRGYTGTVLKMEAFQVDFPPEFYTTIEKARSGDLLNLHVSVDRELNLSMTITHNGVPVPKEDTFTEIKTRVPSRLSL